MAQIEEKTKLEIELGKEGIMELPTAEIICLGNELLIGNTVNTNETYIAKELTMNGMTVLRSTTLRDDKDLAAEGLREVKGRAPDLVVITGGLGPTWDDIQIPIFCEAHELELVLNEEAFAMLKKRYDGIKMSLTEERKKMAYLPAGATALANRVGTAPGYQLTIGKTTWFGLPGVPREMKAIFEDHVLPVVKSITKDIEFHDFKFILRGVPESGLAPVLKQIVHEHPEVYFKSHPASDEGKSRLVFHLTTFAENGEALLESGVKDLQARILNEFPEAIIEPFTER